MNNHTTTRSLIVEGTPEELYRLWSDFESFPRFMTHVKSVTRVSEGVTHWVAEGALGKDAEWDAVMTRDDAGQRLAWRSTDDSPVKTSGQVTFAALPHGQTEVTVTLHFVPPGAMGDVVAKLFTDPEQRLEEDLRGFKAWAEGRLVRK